MSTHVRFSLYSMPWAFIYFPILSIQEAYIMARLCGYAGSSEDFLLSYAISNSYTMGCPPVRGDNPRALASGLSYVQAENMV